MNRIIVAALAAVLFIAPATAQYSNDAVTGASGGGSGTVTSVAAGCGNTASPSPITTTGTLSASITARTNTAASDTIVSGDCGNVVYENRATAVAVAIAQAGTAGFGTGSFFQVCNINAGVATITPTTSTIGGAANYALAAGTAANPSCIGFQSDGTNYNLIGGLPTTDASALTSGTLAAARMPALTGNCVTAAGSIATACDAPHPGYIASTWYTPGGFGRRMTTSQAVSQNRIVCRYGYVSAKVTIGALGARINGVGSTNLQLAIYASSSGRPGAKIGETGNIANTSSAFASAALVANKQVGPGGADGGRDLWFCFNNNDSTATFFSNDPQDLAQNEFIGASTASDLFQTSSSVQQAIYCSGAACNGGSSTFGTWPSSLAGSTWTSNQANSSGNQMPTVAFQPASVP
jgi:hypothetical protein